KITAKPAPATAPVPAPPAAAPAPPPKAAAKAAKPPATPPPPPPAPEPLNLEEALDVDPGTFQEKTAPTPKAYELNQPPATFDATDSETVQEFEQALNSLDAPLPEPPPAAAARPKTQPLPVPEAEISDVSFAEAPEPEPEKAIKEEVRHVKVRSNIDILAELERLRKTSTATPPAAAQPEKPARRVATAGISVDDLLASSLNHRKEVSKVFEVQVPKRQLHGHQVTVGLRFEDREGKGIGEPQNFSIELQSRSDIEKLLLSLKFHILGK